MAIEFSTYPPIGENERIQGYARFEKLFLGKHKEVFNILPHAYQVKRYIICNLAGLISRLSADLLFGEQPDFLAANEDANGAAQEAINRIVEVNSLHAFNYESALSNSFRGDAVYKVRWGKRSPASQEPEVIIEESPASIFFPELNEDDVHTVLSISLAWIKRKKGDANTYLRVEEHEPGTIRHKLFRLVGGKPAEQVSLDTFEQYEGLAEEEQTGLDHIPIFHVPNFRYGSRFWGISDYEGLESIFEAINSRHSQIDEVLDKHVAPKITLPPGYMDEHGNVHLDKMETITLRPGEQPPSYITWDAHLSAAYSQVDKLMETFFLLSETAPTAFGISTYGIAESGRAMRLRMLRTLAKINRKRTYYDLALHEVLYTAQLLEAQFGGADYEPSPVDIRWADGLPEDMMELAQIEAQRLAAGNTSVESRIRRLDGADAVEAELARLAEETGQAIALTGGAGQKNKEVQTPGGEEK